MLVNISKKEKIIVVLIGFLGVILMISYMHDLDKIGNDSPIEQVLLNPLTIASGISGWVLFVMSVPGMVLAVSYAPIAAPLILIAWSSIPLITYFTKDVLPK
ncbi:MAG: hypothetical protein GKS07_08420 [Nitrosopumilus sp.]|nr:MAG: hypothetical protein GKS07_08420 [Nitrosopumilus sp.]